MNSDSTQGPLLLAVVIGLSIIPLMELRSEEAVYSTKTRLDAKIQDHVEKVRHAKSSLDTMRAYEALFSVAGSDGLNDLKYGAEQGIALQVAWNDAVTRSMEGRQVVIGTGHEIKLSRRRLSRFVGFVEGRLHVAVPRWWEKVALSAKVGRRPDVVFDFVVEKHAPNKNSGLGPFVAPGTFLKKRGKELVVSVGNVSVPIPADIAKDYARADESNCCQCLSALVQSQRWYQIVYSSMGESAGSSSLYCIDRNSGEIVWTTPISANHESVLYSYEIRPGKPVGEHVIELRQQGDQILVFGAEQSSIYVNGYRTADGTNLFRFSTDYR